MQKTTHQISPQVYARAGGVLYLLLFAAGFYSLSVWSGLIEPANAAVTVRNVLAAPSRARIASISEILMFVCDIPLAVILYALLRPVDRYLSMMAALFRVLNAAIGSVVTTGYLAAVILSNKPPTLGGLDPQQLQHFVESTLRIHGYANHVALIFFGFHCLLLGYLMFKSGYFPRTLGVLLLIAAACYLVDSTASLVSPEVATAIEGGLLIAAALAEFVFALWLLFRGVDMTKWRAMAGVQDDRP